MRRKMGTRVGAMAMAVAMAALTAMPSFAAFTYTPVAGTGCSFEKYLIMSPGDSVPNVTFSYTIAPGEAVSTPTDDNTVFQVLPGVSANAITITPTVFAPGDTTYNSLQSGDIDIARTAAARRTGDTAETGVEFETTKSEKYAVKTASVDFSNVSFDEPGIYRYIITETASANDEAKGIMHDRDVDRVLDIYVTDTGAGALEVSGYVMHTDINSAATPALNGDMGTADVQTAAAALADKTDGFTNEYKSKDLAFKKEVTGNQASRDKVFDFTLALTGLTEGDKYVVSLAADADANTTDGNADATSATNSATIAANAGKTNVQELTVGQDGNITQHFYLQHGQSIAVRGLPLNANYTVTENKEDYKSEASTVTGYTDATTGVVSAIAGANKAVMTSYKNTRNGVIPTGVALAVGASALVAGIGGAGLVLFGAKSRRNKREDAEENED